MGGEGEKLTFWKKGKVAATIVTITTYGILQIDLFEGAEAREQQPDEPN
jgi:hypothetical protein